MKSELIKCNATLYRLKFSNLCDKAKTYIEYDLEKIVFDEIYKTSKNYRVDLEKSYYCRLDQDYYINREYCFIINQEYLHKAYSEFIREVKFNMDDLIERNMETINAIELHNKNIESFIKRIL
jgi:hypothetical protein